MISEGLQRVVTWGVRLFSSFAVTALFVACGGNSSDGRAGPRGSWEDSVEILGSPSDVKTLPGVYDGYELRACPGGNSTDGAYLVLGTGSRGTTRAHLREIGNHTCAAFELFESIDSCGGSGYTCEGGEGTSVSMYDWREVDGVIGWLGEVLRREDSSVAITIQVAIPASLATGARP